MADDDDDIVWIREEAPEKELTPTTPKTPATIVEPIPEHTTDQTNGSLPQVTISLPQENNEVKLNQRDDDFDKLSTNSVIPPDTPTSCDESLTFDISEAERAMTKTTSEARHLLNQLDEMSKKVTDNNAQIGQELKWSQKELGLHKTIDDHSQVPVVSSLPSTGFGLDTALNQTLIRRIIPTNVESVIIGKGLVHAMTGLLVLPSGNILVTDESEGIIVFTADGSVLQKIAPLEFKRPTCPIYHKDHILILADVDVEGKATRHVVKFSVNLQYVAKIECPVWLKEHTVLRERLSIAHTDHLYLCVCGEVFSGIYELTPIGKWTEIDYKLSEAYIDMVAFATIGPITQLLVVEGRRNYVILMSIRESQLVDRKTMAVCERPGALAKDEAGRLFVANRASASIQSVDTMNWSCSKNIALTDGLIRHFTACWGLLAIPMKDSIRLQRYSFR